MRAVIQSLIFVAAVCAIAPASAELYKWVDERGVTNYSNDPPPAAATANKLARVNNTISVYTPDAGFMQAVKALRERNIKELTEPEPQRAAVGRIAVQQSGYEQCVQSGRLGCDDLYATHPGYLPGAAVYPLYGVRPTRFLPARPVVTPSATTRMSRGPAPR